jgi:hypothetical protein
MVEQDGREGSTAGWPPEQTTQNEWAAPNDERIRIAGHLSGAQGRQHQGSDKCQLKETSLHHEITEGASA